MGRCKSSLATGTPNLNDGNRFSPLKDSDLDGDDKCIENANGCSPCYEDLGSGIEDKSALIGESVQHSKPDKLNALVEVLEDVLTFIEIKGGSRDEWIKKSDAEIMAEFRRLSAITIKGLEEGIEREVERNSVCDSENDSTGGLPADDVPPGLVLDPIAWPPLNSNSSDLNRIDGQQCPVGATTSGKNVGVFNGIKKGSWAALLSENRHHGTCGTLPAFESGGDEVLIEEKDMVDPEEKWKFCLAGYFAGKFPGKSALNDIVSSWHAKVDNFFHKSGWIIFKFYKEEDMFQVLHGSSYLAYGRPLFLKILPNIFQFNNEELSIVPVWIQLKNLPLELWTPNSLGKICSMLGRPLHTDKLTTNRESISYARALVEIDVAKDLMYSVRVRMPNGRTFNQEVSYENVPKFCKCCNMLGHAEVNCKNKKEIEQRKGKKKKDPDTRKKPLDVRLDSCRSKDKNAEKINNAGFIDAVKIGASSSLQVGRKSKLVWGKANDPCAGLDDAGKKIGKGIAPPRPLDSGISNGSALVQDKEFQIMESTDCYMGPRPPELT